MVKTNVRSKMRMLLSKMPGILFLAVLIFLISQHYQRVEKKEHRQDPSETGISDGEFNYKDAVKNYFPEYTDIIKESSVAYQVQQNGAGIGKVIISTPIADDVVGFAGSVPVLLAIGTDNRIMGLSLLDNQESPGFIKRIAKTGFFDSWNGKSIEEAVDLQVEAISGASMSSEAVKENIRKALTYYLEREVAARQIDWMDLTKNICGYLVLLFAFLSMFSIQILKKYRWVLLAASVLVLGFWNGYFISFALLYGWLLNGVPLTGFFVSVILVSLSFLIPLFFGKAYYCSYVCPYGALQELAGKIRKKKTVPKGWIKTVLKYTRMTYFVVLIGILLAGISLDLTPFEPFAAFMYGVAGRWVIALALLFLLLSVFFSRPWCNYFCPTGQLLEIIRRGQVDKSSRRVLLEWILILIILLLVIFILW